METVPKKFKNNIFLKIIMILISDFKSHYSEANELSIISAEFLFFYMCNGFLAWQESNALLYKNPQFTLKQRVYNILEHINIKLNQHKGSFGDFIISINYLYVYRKFMRQINNCCELTIKFWDCLLDKNLSSQRLSDIFKLLLKLKNKANKTAEKIISKNFHYMEFLVRYQMFLKYIINDLNTADKINTKICDLVNNPNITETFKFSIFRTDETVMIVIGDIRSQQSTVIQEVNSEFERVLQYERENIIGHPITDLMTPIAANYHEQFIKNFTSTMTCTALEIGRASCRERGYALV